MINFCGIWFGRRLDGAIELERQNEPINLRCYFHTRTYIGYLKTMAERCDNKTRTFFGIINREKSCWLKYARARVSRFQVYN